MEVHILPTAQQDTENVGLLSYHWTVRTARKALSQLWCLALSTMIFDVCTLSMFFFKTLVPEINLLLITE